MPTGGWRVDCQNATLAWLGTQILENLSVVDREGRPLVTVESITIERSLLALAMTRSDLGKFRLVKPVAYLVTRPNGSNLEDLLSASANKEMPSGNAYESRKIDSTSMEIEIVDGAVRGLDIQTQQQWALSDANLTVKLGTDTDLAGSAVVPTGAGGQSGRIQFHSQSIATGQQQLELLAEQLPLALLEPWIARVLDGTRLTGTASTKARVRWTHDAQRGLLVQTEGRVEVEKLDLTAEMLEGDHLRCERLTAPWQLSTADKKLSIEQISVDAGWAQLDAKGVLSFDELASFRWAKLPKQHTELKGSVALDRLAAMLPHALQLREGVRIDSGKVEFSAGNNTNDRQTSWTATVSVADLAGNDGRRPIRWEEPINATVELVDSQQGARLEQLSLDAPFASAKFDTASDGIQGQFQVDLDILSRELSQFVDLQSWQFRGQGIGAIAFSRQQSDRFEASGSIQLTGLHVAQHRSPVWTESKMKVELSAAGTERGFKPQSLSSATLALRGSNDTLDVQLLEPIDLSAAVQPWKVQIESKGPLESWAGRLRPWLAGIPEQLEGDATLLTRLKIGCSQLHVLNSEGTILQLRVRSDDVTIDEPRVQFSGDCLWDGSSRTLVMRESTLIGSSLAFQTRGINVKLVSGSLPTIEGSVAWRADLQRLASIGGFVDQQDATWPRGEAVGQLQMKSDAKQLQADFTINTTDLQLVRASTRSGAVYGQPEVAWSEPQLQIAGKAIYDHVTDRAQLESLQVQGKTLRLSGSAGVDKLRTEGLLRANGILDYDPTELAQLVEAYFGPEVKLQGDRQVRFQAAGKLFDDEQHASQTHWSQRWNVTVDAGWSAASIHGLSLSGGRLRGKLCDGQLQIAPLDIAVGQGRLTANPRAILAPQPQLFFLPKGPLVSRVAISPQVSETMLKYVAPILAGATRTQGEFSIDLDGTQVPLNDPQKTRLAGRLAVHHLRIAPGPMFGEVAALVGQIEALTKRKQFVQAATSSRPPKALTMTNRLIEFQVVDGRVYHRNLEFLVDDVPVRSHGSVGFDQSLALVIEIPIQDKWVEHEKLLRSLSGKSLQVPIRGTFQKPYVDERAVADLSGQLLQGAAGQAIGDEINRQLDKILRGR